MLELVSIIMPAFNAAKYFPETLDSIKNQSYTAWELIVVDDGSTDETATLVESFARIDSRIKLIRQANGKQGKARNNGIRHAKGEWIAFLDADDIWTPNKLEVQLSKTVELNSDLSFTDGYICLNNDMSRRDHRFGVENKLYQGNEGVQLFHAQNRIPTSTVLVKKSVLEKAGGFPEDLDIQNCEDYFLWTRLLAEGYQLQGIKETLLLYRVYPESSTGKEIKLLFPLLNCLIRIPGNHLQTRKIHLLKTLKRVVELSESKAEFEAAETIIRKSIVELFRGVQKSILLLGLRTNRRIFQSLLWRISSSSSI